MWSLPEILVQNNPELRSEETGHTKRVKALNRRKALIDGAIDTLGEEERETIAGGLGFHHFLTA